MNSTPEKILDSIAQRGQYQLGMGLKPSAGFAKTSAQAL
jgi:hypothetical protein